MTQAPRPPAGSGGVESRRRAAIVAGHLGTEPAAEELACDPAPEVRAAALGALARAGALRPPALSRALLDPSPLVRRRACELAPTHTGVDLRPVLADPDPMVAEGAAWALGERAESAEDAVADLVAMATSHPDPLCREAAVAALGAIGHTGGLAAILAASASERPAIRRRAVIALAPFEGDEVEAALAQARTDRDWQVRQAAEELSS